MDTRATFVLARMRFMREVVGNSRGGTTGSDAVDE